MAPPSRQDACAPGNAVAFESRLQGAPRERRLSSLQGEGFQPSPGLTQDEGRNALAEQARKPALPAAKACSLRQEERKTRAGMPSPGRLESLRSWNEEARATGRTG